MEAMKAKVTDCTMLERLFEIMEDFEFSKVEYTEKDKLCGYELESWTMQGVDILHFVDCRNYGGVTAEAVMEELKAISADFDVDRYVLQYMEGKEYRDRFSIREALDDLEEYAERLTEMVCTCQEAMDSFSDQSSS